MGRILVQKVCQHCGASFLARRSRGQFCSLSCAARDRGGHPVPLERRFWSKVDRRGPDECWPWTAYRNPKGYGIASVGYRRVSAARVSWEIHHKREWPEGMFACHTCDNPPCVNPAHIWPGTAAENSRDMVEKGRSASLGPRCPRGHSYDGQPVYPSDAKSNRRRCRICAAEQRRAA